MESQVKDPQATEFTRSRYDAVARFYDLLEWPMEQFLFRSWRRQLWQDVRGPSVLELGVGTGKNIPFYPPGVEVNAVDFSAAMLEGARRQAARHPHVQVQLEEQDIQQLDFPDDAFDEVVATFVFCSVPDPGLGLHEALRVAKPGGRLLLLEHMRAASPPLGRLMDGLDGPVHYLSGVHIARHTVDNVRDAGWQVDRVVPLAANSIFRRIEAHAP